MWETLEQVPSEIRERYASGEWTCRVPPGPTSGWSELAWINWIFGMRSEEIAERNWARVRGSDPEE